MEVIAHRIIQLRGVLKMSTDTLAGRVGVSPKTAFYWEKLGDEHRDPNLENLVMIARVLQSSPDYLVGWISDPKRVNAEHTDQPSRDSTRTGSAGQASVRAASKAAGARPTRSSKTPRPDA